MTRTADGITDLRVIDKGIEPFCCRQKSNCPRSLITFSTTVSMSLPAGVSFALPGLANLFSLAISLTYLAQYGTGATHDQLHRSAGHGHI